MKHLKHSYRDGIKGRSLNSRPGVGGPTVSAQLECSDCGKCGQLNFRQHAPPEYIDKKFVQAGWRLDPHLCPDCIRKNKAEKENSMASNPSPSAIKAQAKMFNLLSLHFNPEEGHFAKGWSDKKVADETGVAADLVSSFRTEAFGALKEPAEIAALRSDISALEGLVSEQLASLRTELAKVAKAYA